jgi:hypothetical protein
MVISNLSHLAPEESDRLRAIITDLGALGEERSELGEEGLSLPLPPFPTPSLPPCMGWSVVSGAFHLTLQILSHSLTSSLFSYLRLAGVPGQQNGNVPDARQQVRDTRPGGLEYQGPLHPVCCLSFPLHHP